MTAVGCARPSTPAAELVDERRPIVADDGLVYALDTRLETRLADRLELDAFLRERDIRIHVREGIVRITGEVWTPLERERVGALVRAEAGVVDVSNELEVSPPR